MRFPVLFFLYFMLSNCNSPVTSGNLHQFNLVRELPRVLNECSGLVMLDEKQFLAVNDGGDYPNLYIFSDDKTKDNRIVNVKGATNNDWEELTRDENTLYIGDFGNNGGTRRNLRIYKIKIADILAKNEVTSDTILFSYKEQTNFNRSNKNNFDCESVISVGDSLYLFTKNRGNHMTDMYSLPKTSGTYVAKHLAQFNAEGLISGAAFRKNGSENQLVLVGYTEAANKYDPFLLFFDHVDGTNFFKVTPERYVFNQKLQVETVWFYDTNRVLVSSEESKWQNGGIYTVDLKN